MKTINKVAVVSMIFMSIMLPSCESNTEFASYEISGKILENVNSTPLKNIRVIRLSTDYLLFSDTTYTDSTGYYEFLLTDYFDKNATFELKIEDTDKNLNGGHFQSRSVFAQVDSENWRFYTVDNQKRSIATVVADFKLQLIE